MKKRHTMADTNPIKKSRRQNTKTPIFIVLITFVGVPSGGTPSREWDSIIMVTEQLSWNKIFNTINDMVIKD